MIEVKIGIPEKFYDYINDWNYEEYFNYGGYGSPFLKHSAVYSLYRGRTGKSDREAYPQEYTDPQDRRQDYKKKTGEIRQHGSDR